MKKIFNIFSQIFDDEDLSEVDTEFNEGRNENESRIEQEIEKRIADISNIRIPNNKEELEHLLSDLSIQIKSNKWHRNRAKHGKIKNEFSDTLFEKFKQCFYKFQTVAPESQVHYYKSIIKEQTFKRFFQKRIGLIKRVGIITLLLVIVIVLFKIIFPFVSTLFWIFLIIVLLIIAFIIIRKDQENVKYQKKQEQEEQ